MNKSEVRAPTRAFFRNRVTSAIDEHERGKRLLVAIVIAVFAGLVASPVSAEPASPASLCRKLPVGCNYRAEFPFAAYPYVIRPNGCDYLKDITGTRLGGALPLVGLADFHAACMAHDQCYFVVGADGAACNEAFLGHMLAICQKSYCFADAGGGKPAPCLGLHGVCRTWAYSIYGLVRLAKPVAFRNAQYWSRRFEDWIGQNCRVIGWPGPECEAKVSAEARRAAD